MTARYGSRFELENFLDLQKGITTTIKVIDNQNRENVAHGIQLTSVCLSPVHVDPGIPILFL